MSSNCWKTKKIQHALAAPDRELHGLRQYADDPETVGPAALARAVHRDYAALTPSIWEHVNPYGRFDLDMTTRLALL